MSSSIGSTPVNSSLLENVSFAMSSPNGIKTVYLDDNIAEYTDATLKTKTAYILRIANAQTPQIKKKIETGRIAVVRFKDSIPQTVITCPLLNLIPSNRFVLFINNEKGVEGAILLPETVQLKKLPENDYVRLSKSLGAEVKFVSVKV